MARKKEKEKKIIDFVNLTDEERIERWVEARRVLANLPKHERTKHFNMKFWGKKTDCGTVACAAGHCGMDPWFIERGLDLKSTPIIEDVGGDEDEDEDGDKGYYDFDIFGGKVNAFFGIGAEKIFYNYNQRSVATAIKEIDKFITYLNLIRESNGVIDEIEKLRTKRRKILDKAEKILDSL